MKGWSRDVKCKAFRPDQICRISLRSWSDKGSLNYLVIIYSQLMSCRVVRGTVKEVTSYRFLLFSKASEKQGNQCRWLIEVMLGS